MLFGDFLKQYVVRLPLLDHGRVMLSADKLFSVGATCTVAFPKMWRHKGCIWLHQVLLMWTTGCDEVDVLAGVIWRRQRLAQVFLEKRARYVLRRIDAAMLADTSWNFAITPCDRKREPYATGLLVGE